jgi:hypothetical protein
VAVDLTPFVGKRVQIRFTFDTVDALVNGFEGWYVDDVYVYDLAIPGQPQAAGAGPGGTSTGVAEFGFAVNRSVGTPGEVGGGLVSRGQATAEGGHDPGVWLVPPVSWPLWRDNRDDRSPDLTGRGYRLTVPAPLADILGEGRSVLEESAADSIPIGASRVREVSDGAYFPRLPSLFDAGDGPVDSWLE